MEQQVPGISDVRFRVHCTSGIVMMCVLGVDISQVGAEVNVSSNELTSHTDIVKCFTKGKTRHHFAALLVAELIDEETRLKSNVRGRGKEKLDPTIIE